MRIKLLQVKEGTGILVASPEQVFSLFGEEKAADRECFWVVHLNARNEVIEKELVAVGILNQAAVHPREVFKKAILNSAAAIILVHNHPSGSLEPSQPDLSLSDRLVDAGKLLLIPVLDSMIISRQGYYSDRDSFRAEKYAGIIPDVDYTTDKRGKI